MSHSPEHRMRPCTSHSYAAYTTQATAAVHAIPSPRHRPPQRTARGDRSLGRRAGGADGQMTAATWSTAGATNKAHYDKGMVKEITVVRDRIKSV